MHIFIEFLIPSNCISAPKSIVRYWQICSYKKEGDQCTSGLIPLELSPHPTCIVLTVTYPHRSVATTSATMISSSSSSSAMEASSRQEVTRSAPPEQQVCLTVVRVVTGYMRPCQSRVTNSVTLTVFWSQKESCYTGIHRIEWESLTMILFRFPRTVTVAIQHKTDIVTITLWQKPDIVTNLPFNFLSQH